MKKLLKGLPFLMFLGASLVGMGLQFGNPPILADLPLAFLYFWFLFLPESLPLFLLILVGLTQDLFMGTPLGFQAFLYLTAAFFVDQMRKFFSHKDFMIIWSGFLMMYGVIFLLKWGILSLTLKQIYPLGGLTFQGFISLLCFPVIAKLCMSCYRLLYETYR